MNQTVAYCSLVLTVLLVCSVTAVGQQPDKQSLDAKYQTAVANYNSGRYAEAAGQLEAVLPYATQSPVVHELLGMVYAGLSERDKAIEQLKIAVQLKPDWAEARTNFGIALLKAGQGALAGDQLRKAVALQPDNYEALHNLGEYYIQTNKVADAEPLLARARSVNPESYDNSYDLAMADFLLGRFDAAQQIVLDLLKQKNTGELHNLLAHIDEKQGRYIESVNEFETAAHLNPSEQNLFDWATELLLHRTYEPAIQVFQEAARRYPQSPRILIGLGLSLYSRGKYDDAVTALLNAAGLDPSDSRCYRFLSKAYDSSPKLAQEVIQAFRRYADLRPANALAQYYYAMSLWKGHRAEDVDIDRNAIEALLLKAIALDDTLAEAHEQLGNLYSEQHEYAKSVPQYIRALELSPKLADAHYRLGINYVHLGQKELAQKELAVYQQLRAEHLSEVERERAEVQQFVYSEAATPPAKP